MLTHISIRDFALIEAIDLDLRPGLIALTGETGAGKSILVGALSLLAGGRASSEVVRDGADTAVVQAFMSLDSATEARVVRALEDTGVAVAGELIVRRMISRSGRNRIFVNDCAVTLATLQRVVSLVVDILGQHQHLRLLEPAMQRELVDARADNGELRGQMKESFAAYVAARDHLADLESAAADREQRLEYLRYQASELSDLAPREGEVEELEGQLSRARNAGRLHESLQAAFETLDDGEPSASSLAAEGAAALQKAAGWDSALSGLAETAEELSVGLAELGRELSRMLSGLETELDLDALESRDDELRRAARKHGVELPMLWQRAEELRSQIETLEDFGASLDSARAALERAQSDAAAIAGSLTRSRREAAELLFAEVKERLGRLAMPDADIAAEIDGGDVGALSPTGWDRVRIEFTANAGEALRPLDRVASGGELSRLMLAIKSTLASRDPVPTYLFDEVDTGIGGQAAVAVADLLREIGDERQVLCVTHLPQIAARAHHQLQVAKHGAAGRTITTISQLDRDTREHEIARMLGGEEPTAATLAHAREMLTRS